jgi:hypothetical protein
VVLVADRGYDFDRYRRALRSRGIRPQITRRGTLHGAGLGRLRWMVERSLSYCSSSTRLRMRWEHRADIHQAFLKMTFCLGCWHSLHASGCEAVYCDRCSPRPSCCRLLRRRSG